MEVQKEEVSQFIEPRFLSQAQTLGITLRINQMNKNDHEGVIRESGRYEINLEENGKLVTLLKQELSHITAPNPILTIQTPACPMAPADKNPPDEHPHGKPNIQQEFLDKAIRENQVLTLYLINGQRVKAVIEAYDNFTLLLREGEMQHLFYKHAITTINR